MKDRTQSADIVLHGGTVLSVDDRSTVADAIAIKNGRVMALGRSADMLQLVGDGTEAVDLAGDVAIPGMIDNHTHQLMTGLDLVQNGKLNIADAKSIEEIKHRIAAEAKRLGPGKWISTSCMWRGALEEMRFPNRRDLDEVAPDNPVYVFQSGKSVIANSCALALAGIDASTADPLDPEYSQGHIVRDDAGNPTGHLIAGGADLARRRWWDALGLPYKKWDFLYYDLATNEEAIRAQMKVFNAAGVTATRDMGLTSDEIEAYRNVARSGDATVRTELIVGEPMRYLTIDDAERLLEEYDGPRQGEGDDFAWVGGFKFVLQNDNYWSHSPEKIRRLILAANRLGWTLAIHGVMMNNLPAWDMLMDVMIEANAERPLAGRHFSFEHWIGTRRPEHHRLLREWGVTVAPNPNLSYFAAGRSFHMHKALAEVRIAEPSPMSPIDHAREQWGLHIRDWIDAGLNVTGGTDVPATTYDPTFPLLGMYAARTQMSLAGELYADQRVTAEEALRMWTINGARAMSVDDRIGSLEPGKYADIAVLSHNPLEVADEEVRDIRIRKTLFGGKIVFDAEAMQ